jgi:hypothetical protein
MKTIYGPSSLLALASCVEVKHFGEASVVLHGQNTARAGTAGMVSSNGTTSRSTMKFRVLSEIADEFKYWDLVCRYKKVS